jgi:hypothetical protein
VERRDCVVILSRKPTYYDTCSKHIKALCAILAPNLEGIWHIDMENIVDR